MLYVYAHNRVSEEDMGAGQTINLMTSQINSAHRQLAKSEANRKRAHVGRQCIDVSNVCLGLTTN